ncbi:MAG: biotin-dependent carboxyltransferase family protein [Hyphomicrobiaceae bacterium]|nr:biotin-dependent carboxyltransferase family protein [Hyphomicrobiaceae bacterium]
MIEVVQAGLETSVQDFPGRIGYLEQGFPPSGPMDSWSFRLANLLVGNPAEAAGLECQFLGPTLTFHSDSAIAITGADMTPTLDGESVPAYETIHVKAGQTLAMSGAVFGARAYVAVSGGIDTPLIQGSRSTFHMAGIGGVDGGALKAGQSIPIGSSTLPKRFRVLDDNRPPIHREPVWDIEVVRGPNDDWIDEAGHEVFFGSDWKLSAKSNRTGLRLEGPPITFSSKATNKPAEHGEDPSNILDHGYPFGAVNLAGQTPIILANDGPSAGGFINPYTVPTATFWKLAQSRPGQTYRFVDVSVSEAQILRRQEDAHCMVSSLEVILLR